MLILLKLREHLEENAETAGLSEKEGHNLLAISLTMQGYRSRRWQKMYLSVIYQNIKEIIK